MIATTAPTREQTGPISYQFGGGIATGVWLGLGVAQVALVGAGLVVSILALTAAVPTVLAVVPVLGCLSLAVARVAGRPLLDWVAPVLGHHSSSVTGALRWHAPILTAPMACTSDGDRLRLPAEYGRLRLQDCANDASVGLVIDTAANTVTAVFEVAGVDRFPLLDPADCDALIAGWGQSLAVLADTDHTLLRLQLIERATHRRSTDVAEPAVGDGAGADEVLRRAVDALASHHDSRLAVQWSLPRLDDTALATVSTRCRGVSRLLLNARLLTRPLSTAELSAEIATALRGPQRTGAPSPIPGPISRRTSWSHVRTDDTVHRSYAVTGWPSSTVTADWLRPLLLAAPAGVTRTVAIHLEPVSPAAAARTARTARAKAMLDQRDRVRLGMTSSAVIDRAESSGVAMDTELAAGYRTHRLTGLVTVSAESTECLDGAAFGLRQAAAAARLELRPLHGQHDRALAATLPLCRARTRGQS